MIVDCHMHYEPAAPDCRQADRVHGWPMAISKTALIAAMSEPFNVEGRAGEAAGDILRKMARSDQPVRSHFLRRKSDKQWVFHRPRKKISDLRLARQLFRRGRDRKSTPTGCWDGYLLIRG